VSYRIDNVPRLHFLTSPEERSRTLLGHDGGVLEGTDRIT
jgi:hypothetical protein